MESVNYTELISFIALVISLIALTWNIVRDLILDIVSIDFYVTFGEIGNIKNSSTVLFADAGSLKPDHKFDRVGTLFKITNNGRRPIVIDDVGGELKNGDHISIVVDGLPKMLKPYEVFSSVTKTSDFLVKNIKENNLKNIWVKDTKNKKWMLSKMGWKKLKETSGYVSSNKHLT